MSDTIALTRQQNNTPARYRPNADGSFDEVFSLGGAAGDGKLGTPTTGTTSGSAAALGTTLACLSIFLTNVDASDSLKFGDSTAQETPLPAGASVSIPATNRTQVYVKNGSGAADWVCQPIIAA